MPGYRIIGNEFKSYLEKKLNNINSIKDESSNTISYCIDNQTLIILTPINVTELGTIKLKILKEMDSKPDHILVGLVGKGFTEQHIVTAYIHKDEEGKPLVDIYDSKVSDPKVLLQDKKPHAVSGFRTVVRAMRPRFDKETSIKTNTDYGFALVNSNMPANYHSLGTQSIADGKTCGYHAAANIIAIKAIIEDKNEVNAKNIIKKLHSPVYEMKTHINEKARDEGSFRRIYNNVVDFWNKGKNDTYMPHLSKEEKNKRHFGHYFMGWPASKGIGSKLVYFLSLSFILKPLANLLRLPNLIFIALSETFAAIDNALHAWTPKNRITPYLRTVLMLASRGLSALFKGLSLVLGTVTSPIASFKAAWRKNKVLGVLSAVTSIAAYASIAVFAIPAAITWLGTVAAPAILTPIKAAVSALATPVSFLAAKIGVTLSSATSAALSFFAGLGIVSIIKDRVSSLFSKSKKERPAIGQYTEKNDDFSFGSSSEEEYTNNEKSLPSPSVDIPEEGHKEKLGGSVSPSLSDLSQGGGVNITSRTVKIPSRSSKKNKQVVARDSKAISSYLYYSVLNSGAKDKEEKDHDAPNLVSS